jgi:hypothetical protein
MTQIFNPTTPFLQASVMDILFNGIAIDCSNDAFEAKSLCVKLESEKGFKIINDSFIAFSMLGSVSTTRY